MPCSYCKDEKVHAKGYCPNCYARYLKYGSPEKRRVRKVGDCSYCEKHGRLVARDLCKNCYARYVQHGSPEYRKVQKYDVCSFCGTETRIIAKGLCNACYQRQYHHGTPDYRKVRRICSIPGCENQVASKGLCDKHRMRLRKHGDPNLTRVQKTEWSKNFSQATKNSDLKKSFGITLEDYNKMKDVQGDRCAICGQTEKTINSNSRKTQALAVDHCHATGAIRGLLCAQCNNGLGRFKDSPELLEKAAEYIRKHTQ